VIGKSGPKVWTDEEVSELWPQAEGELRGYAQAPRQNRAGITASQLEMALQLAGKEFERLREGQVAP
jgi:1,2-phenylacetyl-CoA epoxidase PaaB subunit